MLFRNSHFLQISKMYNIPPPPPENDFNEKLVEIEKSLILHHNAEGGGRWKFSQQKMLCKKCKKGGGGQPKKQCTHGAMQNMHNTTSCHLELQKYWKDTAVPWRLVWFWTHNSISLFFQPALLSHVHFHFHQWTAQTAQGLLQHAHQHHLQHCMTQICPWINHRKRTKLQTTKMQKMGKKRPPP